MIILASDHRGFALKEEIKKFFNEENIITIDVGTYSKEGVDYPDYAKKGIEKDEFKNYLIDESGLSQGTASSYKSNRDKIMLEMGFSDVLELETHIEDAIDFCTVEKKEGT